MKRMTTPASETVGPTSRVYFSQRLRLHYVDWGNPTAPPLLLVHGGRDHCRNWDWLAAALRKDWHILAPDLRGHGDSQGSPDGRYASIEDALKRMQEANAHLSPEQARHLTQYGVNQNEDGTYSWKFDNYVRADSPYGMSKAEIEQLWERISCPTLMVYGEESWAWRSNPEEVGRL